MSGKQKTIHLKVDEVKVFIRQCLEAVNFPDEAIETISDTLIEADLRGLRTHGILRIPMYLNRVRKGILDPLAVPETVHDNPGMVLVDAHNGMGQLASYSAMRQAILRAKEVGFCLAGVRNSNHFGAAAYYSMMASSQGMIGYASSNTEPLMPAPGGAEKLVGNNPLSWAFPGAQSPDIVVDMAVSAAAIGKIVLADKKGESIPSGWATDKHGFETNSSAEALDGGLLLPAGGPKGYGLSIVVDLLAGLLTDSGWGGGIRCPFHDFSGPQNLGHFFMVFDIEKWLDRDAYERNITHYIERIKKTKRRSDVEEIFLPGEIEFKTKQNSLKEGIPYDENLLSELDEYAKELGVSDNIFSSFLV